MKKYLFIALLTLSTIASANPARQYRCEFQSGDNSCWKGGPEIEACAGYRLGALFQLTFSPTEAEFRAMDPKSDVPLYRATFNPNYHPRKGRDQVMFVNRPADLRVVHELIFDRPMYSDGVDQGHMVLNMRIPEGPIFKGFQCQLIQNITF